MTTKEAKLIAWGAGAGVLAASLVGGIFAVRGAHTFAVEPASAAARSNSGARP